MVYTKKALTPDEVTEKLCLMPNVNDNVQKGPFFYIRNSFIYNTCLLAEGREQAGKLDNSYGHDQLYDDYFKTGEYIYYCMGQAKKSLHHLHRPMYKS